MTSYIRVGNSWSVINAPADHILGLLPKGNYVVAHDPNRGFFLKETEAFEMPSKTYGKEINRYERVIKAFLDRPFGTGLLLSGDKGSGKTLLSKKISIVLAEKHDIPTIIVSSEFKDMQGFISFIQSIIQPCAVVFDEFEKTFSKEGQEKLLTLFDGTMPSKKLFIVTVNDLYRMDSYMINRPGRFFYLFRYIGLSEDAIREYCEDRLNNKDEIRHILNYSKMFRSFTFDMLAGIVEEMNRNDEELDTVIQYLNISYEDASGKVYEVVAATEKDGKETIIAGGGTVNYGSKVNPIREKFSGGYYARNIAEQAKGDPDKLTADDFYDPNRDDDDDDEDDTKKYVSVTFDPDNILSILPDGTFVYQMEGKQTVTIRPVMPRKIDYKQFMNF